jgi:cellulose synthase/poly-beta-1,6-N-acetylglucosamine synthase-like glycosyltransferase
MQLLSAGKKQNAEIFQPEEKELPAVFIIFSAYNEEKVIKRKMDSIFKTYYPLEKIKVVVGSDNSTDATNEIMAEFALKNKEVDFVKFNERNGKASVLNKLAERVKAAKIDDEETVFIFTDANVMFSECTIYELAKHFRNKKISQVAANILNEEIKSEGISLQEKNYIQRENKIKYNEGLWGAMIGAFGACYALRANAWTSIPTNFLMEDFFISMHVLGLNQQAIMEANAVCYEDVSIEVEEEFKRKSRIQAGNFQNLSVYLKLLSQFNLVSFCFFSHKVIRWFGPLLMAVSYMANIFLLPFGKIYFLTFLIQNLLLLTPVFDYLFKKINIQIPLLRYASYFITMNFALANGFFMYANGIKTSAWNPTKRTI